MSEHVYEFGDPVEVYHITESAWVLGRYVANDGLRTAPHWAVSDCLGRQHVGCFNSNQIRPLPKPARGWRLPEPGDVVRTHDGQSGPIVSVNWQDSRPINLGSGLVYYVPSCKPIRLRDDPSPPSKPEEPKAKPEPWVSFDKDEAQRLIGNLSVAADLSDQLESASADVSKLKQTLIAKLIDEVAVALGADR